jgi:hypothetical protein
MRDQKISPYSLIFNDLEAKTWLIINLTKQIVTLTKKLFTPCYPKGKNRIRTFTPP